MSSAKTLIPTSLTYTRSQFTDWVKELKPYFKSLHIDIVDSTYGRESWFDDFEVFDLLTDFEKLVVHLMIADPFEFLFNKEDHLKKDNVTYLIANSALRDSGIKDKLIRLKSLGYTLGVFFNLDDILEIPLEELQYFSEFMFMCVNPGKSGSEFNPKGLGNLQSFKEQQGQFLLDTVLSTDGGFNELTYRDFFNSPVEIIYTNSFLRVNGVKEALNKLSILADDHQRNN